MRATFTLTLLGSAIGIVLVGWIGIVVGLAIGIVAMPVGSRAATLVREIERGP